jgi:hypothetical protein
MILLLAQILVTAASLLAHASSYDGKMVTISGTVERVAHRVSHKGNSYTTFSLCDQSRCVRVFEFGSPAIADGQTRTVTGTFAVARHVGPATYRDEIDVHR